MFIVVFSCTHTSSNKLSENNEINQLIGKWLELNSQVESGVLKFRGNLNRNRNATLGGWRLQEGWLCHANHANKYETGNLKKGKLCSRLRVVKEFASKRYFLLHANDFRSECANTSRRFIILQRRNSAFRMPKTLSEKRRQRNLRCWTRLDVCKHLKRTI